MEIRKEYITIFIIQITEVLGFSLILPFLPFFAEDLGASPFMVGLILSTFSFFQFISAPIIGRLSDFYGRKPLLILSQLSTFISFLILGFANSLWMIFLSRIVDGLLGSNFAIAQAYLSDLSSKEDRSKAFGLSGAAFGFGFLVGPAIGGFLSRFGYGLPAFLAAGVSLITIITTFVFLPETVQKKENIKFDFKIFKMPDFKKYFSNPKISIELRQFFAYILTHALWVSSFALYARKQLRVEANDIGYALAYVGFISIILRGVLLGKIIDFFGERNLKIGGAVSVIIGLGLAAFINQWWMFLVVMTFFALGSGLLRPIIMADISRSVEAEEHGAIIGFTNSLESTSRIFGPLIGGFMINNFYPGSLGVVAAVTMGTGLVFILKEKP